MKTVKKGLRSTDRWSRSGYGEVKYGIGNTVNNVVMAMHGARWVPEKAGDRFVKVRDYPSTMLYT